MSSTISKLLAISPRFTNAIVSELGLLLAGAQPSVAAPGQSAREIIGLNGRDILLPPEYLENSDSTK